MIFLESFEKIFFMKYFMRELNNQMIYHSYYFDYDIKNSNDRVSNESIENTLVIFLYRPQFYFCNLYRP